jgi:hypothetical protein
MIYIYIYIYIWGGLHFSLVVVGLSHYDLLLVKDAHPMVVILTLFFFYLSKRVLQSNGGKLRYFKLLDIQTPEGLDQIY